MLRERANKLSNRIPIPFEQFVEGVLKIDPAKLPASTKRPAVKKAAKKRAAKSKQKPQD